MRAALESAAFQTKDVIDVMYADSGVKITVLRVDGGMTVNNLVSQIFWEFLYIVLKSPRLLH